MGDRGGDVALRGGQRLAVVERLELGELGAVGLDQLGERVDQPGALRRRDLAQGALECAAGRGDGALDVLGAGLGDGDDRLAGRRVDGLERPPVGGSVRSPPISSFFGASSTNARAVSDSDCVVAVVMPGS